MYQYFIKVVPTVYKKLSGEVCVFMLCLHAMQCLCVCNAYVCVCNACVCAMLVFSCISSCSRLTNSQ